jgi:hypothetical protein
LETHTNLVDLGEGGDGDTIDSLVTIIVKVVEIYDGLIAIEIWENQITFNIDGSPHSKEPKLGL